jgi:hypothetical protein
MPSQQSRNRAYFKWFGDKIRRALFDRPDGQLNRALGRHQDDRQSWQEGTQFLDHRESVTFRHVNITDHSIKFFGAGGCQRLGPVPGAAHAKAAQGQPGLQHETDGVLVVDNEDMGQSSHRLVF